MISDFWSQFVGQSVGSCLLTRLIGAGWFGGVFRTDHEVKGALIRSVARKLIESQPESFEQQLGELTTATALKDPRLLSCFQAGIVTFSQGNFLYLVMELADESPETLLKKERLTAEKAIVLTQHIASALWYVDQQKRVHRDLKPGNILRVWEAWKLSDFGTVRQSEGDGTSHTKGVVGTICYMPQESFGGTVSPVWDVWSLGVLVLEGADRAGMVWR
jgi:serine/threonine protein kinase